MATTLDRKRPYGTVHGGTGNTAFEQDGKEFDAQGREIVKARQAAAPVSQGAPAGNQSAVAHVTKDSQGNLFRDGEIIDTEDMTVESVRALASDMGLGLHRAIGKPTALAAIMEAAGPVDQLATQLGE